MWSALTVDAVMPPTLAREAEPNHVIRHAGLRNSAQKPEAALHMTITG
jgi:hypothetical protein